MDAESLDHQRHKFKVTNLNIVVKQMNSILETKWTLNLFYASGKFLVELMQYEHNFTQEFPGN